MLKTKSNLLTKFFMVLAAFVIVLPTVTTTSQNIADAKAKKVKCNGPGTCTKMSYYISPSKTKKLAKQTKELQTPAAIASFIGLAGVGTGIVTLVFGSAVTANQVFKDAAKQGKGVQLSYINHQNPSTSDSYNTNAKYTIK